MNNYPWLVVLAAGMGSRYGGLKQIEPVGLNGEILIEYAAYDAMLAGFGKIVFVIKEENLDTFKSLVGDKISKKIETEYVFQRMDDLPPGSVVPKGRIKPWGTGHALLAARHLVKGSFCVINADDFYGRDAFIKIAEYLKKTDAKKPYELSMVGYKIENTLTENGTVSRGICQTKDSYLKEITELLKIRDENGIISDINTNTVIPRGSLASLNFFGFPAGVFDDMWELFGEFISQHGESDKSEFYLPGAVDSLVKRGKARVRVLESSDHWYGITYKQDRPQLASAIDNLTKNGIYPGRLWE